MLNYYGPCLISSICKDAVLIKISFSLDKMNIAYQKKIIFSTDSERLNNFYFHCRKYRERGEMKQTKRKK